MGLLEDARNIQRKDPAARNVLEVILLYSGLSYSGISPHCTLAIRA